MVGSRVICMSPDLVSLVGPLPQLYYYVSTKPWALILKENNEQLQGQSSTISTCIHSFLKQECHMSQHCWLKPMKVW